jgi:hypothetical protein
VPRKIQPCAPRFWPCPRAIQHNLARRLNRARPFSPRRGTTTVSLRRSVIPATGARRDTNLFQEQLLEISHSSARRPFQKRHLTVPFPATGQQPALRRHHR